MTDPKGPTRFLDFAKGKIGASGGSISGQKGRGSGAGGRDLCNAESAENLRLDMFGVQSGNRVHVGRAGLIDEGVGQDHGAEFQAMVKDAFFGQKLCNM